jgi:PQQ-dependent dehydrogenase (s-GDH family)
LRRQALPPVPEAIAATRGTALTGYSVKLTVLAIVLVLGYVSWIRTLEAAEAPSERFAFRVLVRGLSDPFEITWGPDGYLWVTERTAKRVTRVSPADGSKVSTATIAEALDDVFGMALHPELLTHTGHDYVYLAYTYNAEQAPEALDRRIKIARYTYDAATRVLRDPVDVITNLPASHDHNSGRLLLGPDGKLWYTIGDQGHNQFASFCNPIRAQELPAAEEVTHRDWTRYVGKILRLTLDGSIPDDNPTLAGVRSHIYAYGFRNVQGAVFGPDGQLYTAEHGPKTDDEVNRIQAGKNYGWPHIAGYQDDQAYVYANWSASRGVPCTSLTFSSYEVPSSVPQQKETDWHSPDFVPPLKTFYTVPTGHNFRNPNCAEHYNVCWPSVAPSSLDSYAGGPGGIPAWDHSLLMTTLKAGTLYRLALSSDGTAIPGEAVPYFKTANRYRDIAINPDKRTLYIATDSTGTVADRSGRPTTTLEHPGAILEFRFIGSQAP